MSFFGADSFLFSGGIFSSFGCGLAVIFGVYFFYG